jgi:hypothetical protein
VSRGQAQGNVPSRAIETPGASEPPGPIFERGTNAFVADETEEKSPHSRLSEPAARTVHKLLQVNDLVDRHGDPMPNERESDVSF